MRIFVWMWLMFLVLCLILDGSTMWAVREQMRQNLELALDAGLVAGLSEEALVHGCIVVDPERIERTARQLMRENMASELRNTLEFNVVLDQDGNRSNLAAWASVRIPLILTRLAGIENQPLTVRKKGAYQSLYK